MLEVLPCGRFARDSNDKIDVPPAEHAKAIGGKGVSGMVGDRDVFLGSPKAAGDQNALTPEQTSRIAALNDEGKTVSVLLVDGSIAGAIAMRDEPRPDAEAGLKALADAGVKTVMLVPQRAIVKE
ncbi:hypothetical protein ACL2DZ_08475 (plasmid) [Sinorhizobium meliloti]